MWRCEKNEGNTRVILPHNKGVIQPKRPFCQTEEKGEHHYKDLDDSTG